MPPPERTTVFWFVFESDTIDATPESLCAADVSWAELIEGPSGRPSGAALALVAAPDPSPVGYRFGAPEYPPPELACESLPAYADCHCAICAAISGSSW